MSKIVISIATQYSRREQLQRRISELLPQCDRMNIYLDDYPDDPQYHMTDQKISLWSASKKFADHGKFIAAGLYKTAYELFCDDDIFYPADYVEKTVAAINRYRRKAVITYHGITMKPNIESYYHSRDVLRYDMAVSADTRVQIAGTGVCGYYAKAMRISTADFAEPFMADLYFSIAAKRQGVAIICAAHEEGWLTADSGSSGISHRFFNNDPVQTALAKQHFVSAN